MPHKPTSLCRILAQIIISTRLRPPRPGLFCKRPPSRPRPGTPGCVWVLCLGGREWGTGCSPTACQSAPVRALVVPVYCERGLYFKNSSRRLHGGTSRMCVFFLFTSRIDDSPPAPACAVRNSIQNRHLVKYVFSIARGEELRPFLTSV